LGDYFGIDKEGVWDTVKKNMPPFREKIIRVLEEEVSREIRKNSRAKNDGNKHSKDKRGD
jgi:hypothetical protein